MDDHKTVHLPARNAVAKRQYTYLPHWGFRLPWPRVLRTLIRGIAQRVHFVLVATSLMVSFAGFASSMPYLRLLQPPPLRFMQTPQLNHELVLALGPLPTGIEPTNMPPLPEPEPLVNSVVEPENATLPGPVVGPNPAV